MSAMFPGEDVGVEGISVLGADVTNSSASANTMQDVTGLSFPVEANRNYAFRFCIPYTAAAATTSSRWGINGPALAALSMHSRYALTATGQTVNFVNAYNAPAAANASSLTSGNICVMEGTIRCSAGGNVVARFASEISSSAIVAKAGAFVKWHVIN